MQNFLYSILSLVILTAISLSQAQAQTGETTIFFGTPGDKPFVLNGVAFSTAGIDPVIQSLDLGSSVTKNLANAAFGDLNQFKQDLSTQMRNALLSIPEVSSVGYANIQANPIRVRLTQPGTSVGVMLSGISVNTSIVYHPTGFPGFLCPTALVRATLSDIKVSIEYNVYSGNIENTTVDYVITNRSVNCTSFFGSIAQIFYSGNGNVDNSIANAADSLVQNGNMQTLFSLQDFLESLRQYGNIIEIYYSQMPSQVTIDLQGVEQLLDIDLGSTITIDTPQTPFDISQEVNRVIDAAQGVVNSFGGTSLQLDVLLFEGPTNQISFIASHLSSNIIFLEYNQNTLITFSKPPNTSKVRFYVRAGNNQNWLFLKEYISTNVNVGSNAGSLVVPALQQGTQIIAVSESDLIPGLNGFAGQKRTSTWNYNCWSSGSGNCPNFY